MKFPSDRQTAPNIGKVCSRDQSRPVMTCAHLDVDRGVLEATDSYKLVSVPVDVEEGDVSGFISPEALSAFTKAHKRRAPAPSLQCTETELVLHADGSRQSWDRPQLGRFPNVPQLLAGAEDRSGFRVRLSAKLLAELAAGLGGEEVTIEFCRIRDKTEGDDVGFFPANIRPMIVRNGSDSHGIGLLMPIRIAE